MIKIAKIATDEVEYETMAWKNTSKKQANEQGSTCSVYAMATTRKRAIGGADAEGTKEVTLDTVP